MADCRVIRVDARPKSKERARITFGAKRTWGYTPAGTKTAQEAIRAEWLKTYGRLPIEGPVGMVVTFRFGHEPCTVIQVFPVDRDQGGDPLTEQYADLDNLIKLVKDALQGLAYNNDRQVALLTVTKVKGERPRRTTRRRGLQQP